MDIKNYLPNDILTKVDRMSMAHSIEARVPLLDHKLVEYAAGLPDRMKVRQNQGKWILRQAMGTVLPPSILHRRKKPMFAVNKNHPPWNAGELCGRFNGVNPIRRWIEQLNFM